MHGLLSFTVTVESHDSDSNGRIERHLDVSPLIEGKKDRTGICFELIILGIDVNSEGSLGVEPDGKGLAQLNQMMLIATNSRTSTVSLASNVHYPHRHRIAEILLIFKVFPVFHELF